LASVLYIITNLERMGDHAEGIADINQLLGDEPLPRRVGYISAMAGRAVSTLRDTLRACVELDVDAARRICEADYEVDRLQDSVYEDCFREMIARPETIQRNTYLIWTSHNIERIADRCTNTCERVTYLVTGRMEEINVSRY
jgi:phosphate transport system protein